MAPDKFYVDESASVKSTHSYLVRSILALDLPIPRRSLVNVHWLLTVPVPIFLVSQLQATDIALRSTRVHLGDY
jgi:hypothetical protein